MITLSSIVNHRFDYLTAFKGTSPKTQNDYYDFYGSVNSNTFHWKDNKFPRLHLTVRIRYLMNRDRPETSNASLSAKAYFDKALPAYLSADPKCGEIYNQLSDSLRVPQGPKLTDDDEQDVRLCSEYGNCSIQEVGNCSMVITDISVTGATPVILQR